MPSLNYSLSYIQEHIPFVNLPNDVVEAAKQCMLNASAAGLAGASQPASVSISNFIQNMGSIGKCTLIGMGVRTSPIYAAFGNSFIINILDYNEEISKSHDSVSAVIFPIVMSLGEIHGYTGQEVLRAYILGIEYCLQLLDKTEERQSQDFMKCAALGGILAASILLNFDDNQFETSLYITSNSIVTKSDFSTIQERSYLYGQCSMNVMTTALSIQNGFTISDLENDSFTMFLRSLGLGPQDHQNIIQSLSTVPLLHSDGLALKLYPCPSASHECIEAILLLLQQYNIDHFEISSVQIKVPHRTIQECNLNPPLSESQSKTSLPFIVASTIIYGQPLIEQFTKPFFELELVHDFMKKITITENTSLTSSNFRTSEVVIKFNNGEEISNIVDFARGTAVLPLDQTELEAKFLYCSRYILPPDHIEGAISQITNLQDIADITGLVSILGG
jgi:2-methylcitrate dehydratase PrpD